MRAVLPFIVIGVTSGSVYALAGMGLTLTFKTSGIVNFAHGAQAALAAFVFFELRQRVGLAWPLAAVIALALAGVLAGLVLERLAAALAGASTAARVAAMVGLLVGVEGALVAVFGSSPLQSRFFLPSRLLHAPGVNVRVEQIIVSLLVFGVAGALYIFFRRARLGAAMRAVVDEPTLLSLEGISPVRVRRAAWVLGSCFAAGSGILIAPRVGLDAAVLTELVFFAFGAAAVGGFTSLPLTYAGGLAIGVGSSLMTHWISTTGPIAALPSALPVIVLFAAMLLLPRSRFTSPPDGHALPPLAWSRRTATGMTIAVGAALIAVPHLVGTRISDYTTALGFVVLFVSLGLLVRASGQISLCHIAFAAVGATTLARALGAGIPWPLALLLGGLVAAPVGALVAIPVIRLSGIYLGVATMGFGLLVEQLVYPSFWMFGGAGTILRAHRPVLGGLLTNGDTDYYYVALGVTAACCAVVVAIRRGRLGRLMHGLSDQPLALDAQGTNTNVTRLLVFCISAFLAGIGGALIAPVTGSVTAGPFDFSNSLLLVAVVFTAGRQPVLGALTAAALYVVGPSYLTSPTAHDYVPVVFGIAAIVASTAGGRPLLAPLAASRRTQERLVRHPARARRIAGAGT